MTTTSYKSKSKSNSNSESKSNSNKGHAEEMWQAILLSGDSLQESHV